MNALKDMLYYTHPIADPTDKGSRMYVIDTAYDRNSHIVGTVVDISERSVLLNGKVWKITTDGTYVAGHIVNTTKGTGFYHSQLVGLTSHTDEHFCHGVFESFGRFPDGNNAIQYMQVQRMRTSDGSHYSPSGHGAFGHLTTWVMAAPWTAALMPFPTDNAATIIAKRALAEKKWKLHRAVAEMANEGYQRGWTDNLRELHSNDDLDFLPRPRLGIMYTGNVLISNGQRAPRMSDLEDDVAQKVRALEGVSITPATPTAPVVPVNVIIPLDMKLDPERLELPEIMRGMEVKIREQLDDSSAALGAHRVQYFVNGLSSYDTL